MSERASVTSGMLMVALLFLVVSFYEIYTKIGVDKLNMQGTLFFLFTTVCIALGSTNLGRKTTLALALISLALATGAFLAIAFNMSMLPFNLTG